MFDSSSACDSCEYPSLESHQNEMRPMFFVTKATTKGKPRSFQKCPKNNADRDYDSLQKELDYSAKASKKAPFELRPGPPCENYLPSPKATAQTPAHAPS